MSKDSVTLNIKVKTNGKENKILGIHANFLKISIKALPIDGKANTALIHFLAQELMISKQNIKIVSGLHTVTKRINIPLNDSIKKFLTKMDMS